MAEKESKKSTSGKASVKKATQAKKAAQARKAAQAKKAQAKPKTETTQATEATTESTESKSAGSTSSATAGHTVRIKPELDDAAREALGLRRDKKSKTPRFRRQEWWRYKDLGGKHAPWRRPRGIHSKQRRHIGYRPPVASIGYRGPAAARGLHPSGFEEVLVHRPQDLDRLDAKTQAARVGRTVGGRKAEAIEAQAATLGIRILNPRGES